MKGKFVRLPSPGVEQEETKASIEDRALCSFKKTMLGGTFDHLHSGHKLLLTCALLLSKEQIGIGVTTAELLKKKSYNLFIEDFELRKERVADFVATVAPKVKAELFSLENPVGPAGTDEQLEALILTREVEKGGVMVNEAREKNGLPPLHCYFVDMVLVEEGESQKFSNKTSSSYIRQYLAEKTNQNAEKLFSDWMELQDRI